mmetsp:Transcript_59374/g.141550  ORF Transcript_59374/g.141550 Transcript_59374/m.141550 type:complete len:393 (+) Transcript_59374:135-1313(+)
MAMRILLSMRCCMRTFLPVAILSALHTLQASADGLCDIQMSGPICLSGAGQERVVVPPAAPWGLTGFWNFDAQGALDSSGLGFHGMEPVVSGPAVGGGGRSAFFQRSFLTVPVETPGPQSLDFSYTFWVHLLEEPGKHHQGLRHCPLVRKGLDRTVDEVAEAHSFAAAPAVMFDQLSGKLHVEMATDAQTAGQGATPQREVFESHSRLRHGRWFHVALVRMENEKQTRLYVNGILDATVTSEGHVVPNAEPLYVGGDPVVGFKCATPLYIDEVKRYSRPLSPDEIQAEAAPSLSGIEPAYVRLACVDCTLETAMAKCPTSYHVCNDLELHVAGYQVARTLGLLTKDTKVWSHSAGAPAAAPGPAAAIAQSRGASAPGAAESVGLGLCCMDSE